MNNPARRRPMQATRAPTRSHRASRVIAALPIIATTFFIHAMVWHYFRQLKMSRPDAYAAVVAAQAQEAVRRDAAFEEGAELVPNKLRQAGAGCRFGLLEEGGGVLLHQAV